MELSAPVGIALVVALVSWVALSIYVGWKVTLWVESKKPSENFMFYAAIHLGVLIGVAVIGGIAVAYGFTLAINYLM